MAYYGAVDLVRRDFFETFPGDAVFVSAGAAASTRTPEPYDAHKFLRGSASIVGEEYPLPVVTVNFVCFDGYSRTKAPYDWKKFLRATVNLIRKR